MILINTFETREQIQLHRFLPGVWRADLGGSASTENIQIQVRLSDEADVSLGGWKERNKLYQIWKKKLNINAINKLKNLWEQYGRNQESYSFFDKTKLALMKLSLVVLFKEKSFLLVLKVEDSWSKFWFKDIILSLKTRSFSFGLFKFNAAST